MKYLRLFLRQFSLLSFLALAAHQALAASSGDVDWFSQCFLNVRNPLARSAPFKVIAQTPERKVYEARVQGVVARIVHGYGQPTTIGPFGLLGPESAQSADSLADLDPSAPPPSFYVLVQFKGSAKDGVLSTYAEPLVEVAPGEPLEVATDLHTEGDLFNAVVDLKTGILKPESRFDGKNSLPGQSNISCLPQF